MSAEPASPAAPPHEAYTVNERVAVGTAGVIYRAVQERSGREVTFKVLSATSTHPLEPERVKALRWRIEALQHPVIAELLDEYDDPDGYVIVTSWMADGVGGNDFPSKRRKLTKQEARLVAMRMCGALLAGEQQRFPHGDIKPSNVVLTDRGQQGLEVQIQDWGLSACREEQPPESLQYLAPERHHGHPASSQGDLFSAGATLWFLLTGESPAYGGSAEEVLQSWGLFQAASLSQVRPDLDEHFCQWLGWLMRWQPGDRPQSVAQALDVLSEVMTYAAALEAQTKSQAIATATPDPEPAPEAAVPAVTPLQTVAAPSAPAVTKPAAATPGKPMPVRPAAASPAKPGGAHAHGQRLKLPVAVAAPPPATSLTADARAKSLTKGKDQPPRQKMNKAQRVMAAVMVICLLAGICVAFVAWAEDQYGHDWRRKMAKHWGDTFSGSGAPTAKAASAPVAETSADEEKPAAPAAKTAKPAAAKAAPAKVNKAAKAAAAPKPKPFAVDKFIGTGDLQGRAEGSGWKGPWQAQHVSLEKDHAVLGGGNESSATRALGTIKNLSSDYLNLSLLVTHPGKDAGPLKLDVLSADGKTLVAPACVAFEDGKVRVSIDGADTKIEAPVGKPFRLLVKWDWKTKKSGGKRLITVTAMVDPSDDPEKNKALPSSTRTIGERKLPEDFSLALVYENAAQPVTVSDLRVGRYMRDALP